MINNHSDGPAGAQQGNSTSLLYGKNESGDLQMHGPLYIIMTLCMDPPPLID